MSDEDPQDSNEKSSAANDISGNIGCTLVLLAVTSPIWAPMIAFIIAVIRGHYPMVH